MYKFRTMVKDAEQLKEHLWELNEQDGPVFKIKNDPYVTLVGRFPRKYSLDEFPQMWNVVKGDMSLVGPRPPLDDEVAQYKAWRRGGSWSNSPSRCFGSVFSRAGPISHGKRRGSCNRNPRRICACYSDVPESRTGNLFFDIVSFLSLRGIE